MKYSIIAAALAVAVTAQDTTQNPLESIYSVASEAVASYESAASTTDPLYDSALSLLQTEISMATASLANNPSSAEIYSELVSQYSSLLASYSDLATITDVGSLSSIATSIASSVASDVSSGLGAASTAASNSASSASATAASTSNVAASNVQVGVMGAAGAAVLGLAAFL